MSSFESDVLYLIRERETIMFEVERALFTGRYKMSNRHLSIFSVHSVALIYSLWEGFIQLSFQRYLTEINAKQLDFMEFTTEIKIFHIENTLKQFKEYPGKNSQKSNFYNQLSTFFKTDYHPIYPVINTQSNVGFDVLNIIMKSFNLESFPEHWSSYAHPNTNLKNILKDFLRYRNGVAHGGDISSEEKVTQIVYSKYKQLVSDLMYSVLDKMLYGINNETYKL